MPKRVVSVWRWEDGWQVVVERTQSYWYLSWRWPFVTRFRIPTPKRVNRQYPSEPKSDPS